MNVRILGIIFLGLAILAGCVEPPIVPYECSDGTLVDNMEECPAIEEEEGCLYDNPACEGNFECIDNECVALEEEDEGCDYNNPSCAENEDCVENECLLKQGCEYENPACKESQFCVNNECISLGEGCLYNNPSCTENEDCVENECLILCENSEDCGGPEYKCTQNHCEYRGACKKDSQCSSNEVCVALECAEVLDCASAGSFCEDENFLITSVIVTDEKGRITVKAKIMKKTNVAGKFRIVVNMMDFEELTLGSQYEMVTNILDFNNYIIKPDNGLIEHALLEHIENPHTYYLVYRK